MWEYLLELIPNKAINHLGIVVDANIEVKNNINYLKITVFPSLVPISYHGSFYIKSGSTKHELRGIALQQFLLKKFGRTYEDLELERLTLDDINQEAVNLFLKKALRVNRISEDAKEEDLDVLLKNLNLMTDDNKLRNSAILLFGKKPQRHVISSSFRIGRFGVEDHDLRFQDVIEGNIFEMPNKVMEVLKAKYLICSY